MKTMPRFGLALAGMLSVLGAAAAAADSKPADARSADAAPAATDEARFERRLEAAQRRLEQAAKEVAELSASMATDKMKDVHIHIGESRAMLGVQLGEAQAGGGVRVAGVSPGGAASDAGVKPGDVIISINGRRVASPGVITHEMHALKPGDPAKLEIDRGGKVQALVVTTRGGDPRLALLGGDFDWPAMASLGNWVEDWHGGQGGFGELELCVVSPDLGRYFGTDKGVLVVKAPADGALKLRDGDVITAIDGREPQGVSHALRILRSYQPGEHATLAILRDRKPQKVDVTIPARSTHEGHGFPHVPAVPAVPAAPAAPAAAAAPAAPPPPPAPQGADA